MDDPNPPSIRKQVYWRPPGLRTAAAHEAAQLGQSWSSFVCRAVEHALAIRHPDSEWTRHAEFEEVPQ